MDNIQPPSEIDLQGKDDFESLLKILLEDIQKYKKERRQNQRKPSGIISINGNPVILNTANEYNSVITCKNMKEQDDFLYIKHILERLGKKYFSHQNIRYNQEHGIIMTIKDLMTKTPSLSPTIDIIRTVNPSMLTKDVSSENKKQKILDFDCGHEEYKFPFEIETVYQTQINNLYIPDKNYLIDGFDTRLFNHEGSPIHNPINNDYVAGILIY